MKTKSKHSSNLDFLRTVAVTQNPFYMDDMLRNPVAQWTVFVLLAVLLPWLAYHLIEHPAIELGRKLAVRIEH